MYATVTDDNGREMVRQLFGDAGNTFVGMGAPEAPAGAAPQHRTPSSRSSSSPTSTSRAC